MRKERSPAQHGEVHRSIPTIAFEAALPTVLFAAPVAANEEGATSLNQMAAVIGVRADVFEALENEDQPAWQRLSVSWLETATFRYAEGQWRVGFMESMRRAPLTRQDRRPSGVRCTWRRTPRFACA